MNTTNKTCNRTNEDLTVAPGDWRTRAFSTLLALIWFGLGTLHARDFPPTNGCLAGAYLGGGAADLTNETISSFNQRTGKRHAIFLRYVEVRDGQNSMHWTWAQEVAENGGVPFFIYDPTDGLPNLDANAVSGFADRCAQLDIPVLVAFAHEANGNWYTWGQQPELFKNSFRVVAEIFHARSPKIQMAWIMNQNWGYPWGGNNYGDGYSEYYPTGSGAHGDYVDWVGLNRFEKDYEETNLIPSGRFRDMIRYGQANMDFYHAFAETYNKPMLIAETAAFDANIDPTSAGLRRPLDDNQQRSFKNAWITQVYDAAFLQQNFPLLRALCWFSTLKTEAVTTASHDFGNIPVDFRIPDTSVYSNQIANPYFMEATNSRPSIPPQVVAWGDNSDGQTNVPLFSTNVVAIASGSMSSQTLALKPDGNVIAWGGDANWPIIVPPGLTNLVAVSVGSVHNIALTATGTVVAWGYDDYGQINVPPSLTNVVAIAAGPFHNLALRPDGAVVAWGSNNAGQTDVPPLLTNVVAIAAGYWHSVALKADGTVVVWGGDCCGQTAVPSGLTNVIAISAGFTHTLALTASGTVIAWGQPHSFFGGGDSNVPAGLTNMAAISAAYAHSLALKVDGTIVAWGQSYYGETNIPTGLTNVAAIAAGVYHNVALLGSGPPFLTSRLVRRTATIGGTVFFRIEATGAGPLQYQWRCNGTNLVEGGRFAGVRSDHLGISDVTPQDAGSYSVEVRNALGSVVSTEAALGVALPTGRIPVSSLEFHGVTYGGDGFRVVGAEGRIYRETANGWVGEWSPTGQHLRGVCSLPGGGYVAVGDAGVVLLQSPPAREWSLLSSGTTAGLFGVAAGPNATGTFVAVGEGGKILLFHRDDRGGWTARDVTPEGNPCFTLYSVAYSGRYLVVGDADITFVSTNGSQWSQFGPPVSYNTLFAVTSMDNSAFGAAGYYSYYGSCFSECQFLYPDSSSWGVRGFQRKIDALHGIASGEGRIIACGASGTIVDVTAASTFSVTPTSNYLYAVACGGGRWIAVGENATILVSSNSGQDWQLADVSTLNPAPILQMRGRANLQIKGTPGNSYRIEWSEDLSGWYEGEIVRLTNTSQFWTDSAATGLSKRFYRARDVGR